MIAAVVGVVGLLGLVALGAGEHWWSARPGPGGVQTPYDDDRGARELYLTSRFESDARTAASLDAAEKGFRQLTERYPDRAAGWSGLAQTYLLLREFGAMTEREAYARAARTAHTAVALDPKLADAWLAQAFVAFWGYSQVATAFRYYETALRLDPSSARGWHWYATSLYAHGEFAPALQAIARARAMDEGNRAIVADEALVRLGAGEREQAVSTLEKLEELDPSFRSTHRYLSFAYAITGRDADFLREALAAAQLQDRSDQVAGIELARKRLQEGGRQAMLEQLTANEAGGLEHDTGSAVGAAMYRALAGDRNGMLYWLAIADGRHEPRLMELGCHPFFAPYRGDPAVQAILARVP